MQAITCCCSQQQGTPILKRHDCTTPPMGLLQTYKQAPLFVSDHECEADVQRQDLSCMYLAHHELKSFFVSSKQASKQAASKQAASNQASKHSTNQSTRYCS